MVCALDEITFLVDGGFSRRFLFGSDFPGFAGHFPGNPMLPAIVQIQTALILAEEALGRALDLVEIENAKFLLPVKPGQEICVKCRECSDPDGLIYQVTLSVGKAVAAKFRLAFSEYGVSYA